MKTVRADDPKVLDAASGVLDDGGLVVIPTETVYGLCARWDRELAVSAIFEVKSRGRDKPLQVLVAEVDQALSLGRFDTAASEAAAGGWPGPLTVVVPRSDRSRGIFLGGNGSTIGLRVPDHDLARDLIRITGPLAATSANPAGVPTGATIDEIRAQLMDAVSLYVDAGPIEGRPSRVVSFIEGESELRSR